MVTLLFIFQIIITIVLVISIMLQKSSSIGLGGYSGSNESLFGAKGPAGFLAKFTAIMAIVFVANTIGLSYFYQQNKNSSVIDKILHESAVPSVPLAPKSINETSDTLDLNSSKNLPVEKAIQNEDANLSATSDVNPTQKAQNSDINASEANSTN